MQTKYMSKSEDFHAENFENAPLALLRVLYLNPQVVAKISGMNFLPMTEGKGQT
jgi:hypothetical protein